jgi:O-antigen/teichoic acid export membrane protein
MSSGRLARNAAASVAQVLLSATALFLTYRLLAQHLPIEQIGLWALIIGSTAVARLAEFGLGAGVVRFVAGDVAAGRRDMAARTAGMAAVAVLLLVGVAAMLAYPLVLPALLSVTPSGLGDAARLLLECALASVVMGAVGNVFLGTLDGCQRMDVRAALQVCGNLIQLIATWIALSGGGGLGALGAVQIAQAAFLMIGGAILTFKFVGAPAGDYVQFDSARLRQIASYGGALQVSAVAQMLFEPLTKVMLTGFGGLALTGYFELANRLILQLRGIIVAAYAALVPHVAAQVSDSHFPVDEIRAIYVRSFRLLLYVLLPCLACVAAGLPLALTLWLGRLEPMLLSIALLQFVGWSVNTLNAPAYYLFISLGKVRAPILAHVLIGLVTATLGSLCGFLWGGAGVLIGAWAALVAGSLYLVLAFHRVFDVHWRDLAGGREVGQTLLVAAGLVFAGTVAVAAAGRVTWPMLLAPPICAAIIALVTTVRNPIGRQVAGWLGRALRAERRAGEPRS